MGGGRGTYQSVIRSDHLPYEATPAYIVLQISTDFHLEFGPTALECICAELQKHTGGYTQHDGN